MAAAIVTLLALAAAATLVGRHRQAEQAAQDAAAQRARAQEAREQEKAEAEAEAQAEVLVRRASVDGVEKSVTKMAREHASQGAIEGWPESTRCSPAAGQRLDNLRATTTKFSCFVITERLGGGRSRGHYYEALMNWQTGRYTYGYAD